MKLFDKLFKNKNICKIEGDNNTVNQQIDIEENEELVVPLIMVRAKTSFTLIKECKKVKSGDYIQLSKDRAEELEKKGYVERVR